MALSIVSLSLQYGLTYRECRVLKKRTRCFFIKEEYVVQSALCYM